MLKNINLEHTQLKYVKVVKVVECDNVSNRKSDRCQVHTFFVLGVGVEINKKYYSFCFWLQDIR